MEGKKAKKRKKNKNGDFCRAEDFSLCWQFFHGFFLLENTLFSNLFAFCIKT
jgi:hypothetical protein